jgi:hypothetical protein
MKEWLRREILIAGPFGAEITTQDALDDNIVSGAENPIYELPTHPDIKAIAQSCLDFRKQSSTPK